MSEETDRLVEALSSYVASCPYVAAGAFMCASGHHEGGWVEDEELSSLVAALCNHLAGTHKAGKPVLVCIDDVELRDEPPGNGGSLETGLFPPWFREYVYFVQVDSVLWKIGSTKHLARAQMLARKTVGGSLRHIIPTNNCRAYERHIHDQLADCRIAGSEVFRFDLESHPEPWRLTHYLQKRCYGWPVP